MESDQKKADLEAEIRMLRQRLVIQQPTGRMPPSNMFSIQPTSLTSAMDQQAGPPATTGTLDLSFGSFRNDESESMQSDDADDPDGVVGRS